MLSKAPSSRILSDVDKLLINAGLLQKFFVRALLCNLAVVNDQNLIGILDGIQTVGDYEKCLALYHIRAKNRADFANVAGSKIAHRKFPQMAAQFHAFIRKHQISCGTLQAVAEVMNKHLHQHCCGKSKADIKANGNVMLSVDNLLNGFPCMVVVFGCVVCLLMIVLPKSLSVVLTMVYVAFILYETLMFRESGDARTNFVLFSYAGKFLKEQSVRVGVINNIWLFIPLGTGLYRWYQKKWVLLIPFVMSVAIETTQYITGLGIAEFDDVFGNTMGGWIGVLVAWMWLSWKMSVKNRT